MKNETVYISGQMTGLSKEKYTFEFGIAEAFILNNSGIPVNPVEISKQFPEGSEWSVYLKEDLKEMLKCDSICMLSNWKNSKGAIAEHFFAEVIGLKIYYRNPADKGKTVEAKVK